MTTEKNAIGFPTESGGFEEIASDAPKASPDGLTAQDVAYGNETVDDALTELNSNLVKIKTKSYHLNTGTTKDHGSGRYVVIQSMLSDWPTPLNTAASIPIVYAKNYSTYANGETINTDIFGTDLYVTTATPNEDVYINVVWFYL